MKSHKAWSEMVDYLEQLPGSNTTAKWKGGFTHVFDRYIFCRYEYVSGITNTWILETGDTLICRELQKENTFDIASIKEFAYVLEPYGDRRFWTEVVEGQTAIAYVIDHQDNPSELCRISVLETVNLASKSKAYDLMGMVVNDLGNKYNKPSGYKHGIYGTRTFNKYLENLLLAIGILFIIIISILVLG